MKVMLFQLEILAPALASVTNVRCRLLRLLT
jgi:hypothetical protein